MNFLFDLYCCFNILGNINFSFVFTELAARENSEQARVQHERLKSESGDKWRFSSFMFGNDKDKKEVKKKKRSSSQHQRVVVAVKTIKGKKAPFYLILKT